MRLMHEHYPAVEKTAGYTCIRCQAEESCAESPFLRIASAFKSFFADFVWPGGYPILFTTGAGAVLCADCAKRAFILDRIDVTADCYYEGPTLRCDGCDREIESAYGDPGAVDE